MSDLRKLAEAATPGPWRKRWYGSGGYEGREGITVVTATGSINCDEIAYFGRGDLDEDTAQRSRNGTFIAAASPDVVLGLLDERDNLIAANRACVAAVAEWGAKAGSLQAEADRLRDLFKVEKDVHRQHTRGLNKRLDMERDTIVDIAAGFRAERDEAHAAVRRLAGALKESMSDDSIEAYGGALQALADPIVKRIVEGG